MDWKKLCGWRQQNLAKWRLEIDEDQITRTIKKLIDWTNKTFKITTSSRTCKELAIRIKSFEV